MGLPSRSAGLGFDLHPNSSPSPNKPIGAGANPFGKPKSELSSKIRGENLNRRPLGYDPGDVDVRCASNSAAEFSQGGAFFEFLEHTLILA
jgi:LSD1 subclass zinc finger protein